MGRSAPALNGLYVSLLAGVWSESRRDARGGLCVTPTVTPERKLDVATGRVVPSNSVQIKRLSATHRKGTVRLAVSGHQLKPLFIKPLQ